MLQIWSTLMRNKEEMICRICGLIQLEAPWGEDGKTPNFEICACCGVEFGYEDSTITGIKSYRKNWLDAGATWEEENEKPDNWSIDAQLRNIPKNFQ